MALLKYGLVVLSSSLSQHNVSPSKCPCIRGGLLRSYVFQALNTCRGETGVHVPERSSHVVISSN